MVSVKSRGWGAITCRDASAQPGTHQLPSGCIRVRKPCQHAQHKGLVLRSRGRQRREVEDDRGREEAGEGRQEAGEVQVIAGYDSGGQCQGSFRIHSLRSSCYIFYWRNKRMACYVRMRAIFLRVASKGIRRKQECLWEKNKILLSGTQRQPTSSSLLAACCMLPGVSCAGSHPVIVWVKSHLRWIARRAVSNTYRQINTWDPILFLQYSPIFLKIHFWHTCSVWVSFN